MCNTGPRARISQKTLFALYLFIWQTTVYTNTYLGIYWTKVVRPVYPDLDLMNLEIACHSLCDATKSELRDRRQYPDFSRLFRTF